MSQLEELVASVLSIDPTGLGDGDGPSTIKAWDSLNHVMLAGAIEEEFSITFSTDELLATSSIGDFRRLLRAKGCEV